MKKKNISKKLIAVILSVVMVAVSIPFMLMGSAAGGEYDPAPYFDDAAREEGARAWLGDDGNVHVVFPSAIAMPTFKGEPLNIAFYILELTDMGAKNATHTKISLDTIKVNADLSKTRDNYATFPAANIGTIDLANRRYNVEITAVDEQNWFSQSLHTAVTDVPAAQIDADKVTPLVTDAHAAREIMTFDSDANSKDDWQNKIGDDLIYKGIIAQTGTTNATNTEDTSALGFVMYNQPATPQIFETNWSRQTWDFAGAEEMWVWMDLEDVQLEGFAFRIRTNEKTWEEWIDDKKTLDQTNRVGDMVYSTKGTAAATYTGEDPYIYIQQEDGTWEKHMFEADGTIDFGGFTGYVRVPLKFICSETDQYVDNSNQDIACGYDYKSGVNNTVQEADVNAWLTSMTFTGDSGKGILVDPAGTSISDAMLIHRRSLLSSSGFLNGGDRHRFMWNAVEITHNKQSYTSGNPAIDLSAMGYMLAIPLEISGEDAANDVKTGEVSTDRAYIDANGVVQNRAGGLKAIQDVWAAGFELEGGTVKEDFYIDNIFFYRTDGGQYTQNTVGTDSGNIGDPVNKYYDEELETAKIIFREIDKYIENPNWTNYREVEYILDFIQQYKDAYAIKAPTKDLSFLEVTDPTVKPEEELTGLAAYSKQINDTEYAKFWEAYQDCLNEGTLAVANAEPDELVPLIVNTLEKMPKAKDVKSVSNVLRLEIIKVWRAYSLLNLGQLEMFGAEEEQEIFDLIALLDNFDEGTGDQFVVGSSLADLPYIVFNDFEEYDVGEQAYKLENDNNAFTTDAGGTSDLANDWRHLKGLITYTTNGEDVPSTIPESHPITDKDYLGYITTDSDKVHEALDGKVHYDAAFAEVDTNGYLNSKAVTTTVESTYTTSAQDGSFHTVTFTRDSTDDANATNKTNGKNFNVYTEMEANNMSSTGIGELVAPEDDAYNDRLSLIFYVDFTEITENFYFTVNMFSKRADGTYEKLRPQMGLTYNKEWRTYFILDNATGEWVMNVNDDTYCYTATPNTDSDNGVGIPLNGYKGYLKIPVKHFKWHKSGTDEPRADEDVALLNNIYAIQFAVGGATTSALYGKSYSIDNVGFTYNPEHYPNLSVTHDSYAEIFAAKSNEAYDFEKYVGGETLYTTEIQSLPQVDESGNPVVDENGNQVYVDTEVQIPHPGIDIYDEATNAERVAKAIDLYNALPAYQKTVVANTYNILLEYQEMVNNNTVPTPTLTPEQLNSYIAGLPQETREASVSGYDEITGTYYDLTYPGFVDNEVNYAGYKLDPTTAQQIIDYYNNSYAYYSKTEKSQVNTLEFINAYKAAMRTHDSLVKIKADVDAVAPDISDLYTPIFDSDGNRISSFAKIAERQTVQDFYNDRYLPMRYYAKTSLANGQLQKVYQNASRGMTYFLKNVATYSIDGETINGGIITYRDKMQTIYDNAKTKIDNKELFTEDNEELFTKDELQEIKDLIEEYNNLLPAYYNVKELYDLEQLILGLFPVIDEQIDVDKTDILLSEDTILTDTSTVTIDYAQALDLKSTGDKYYIKVTSQNGALTNAMGDSKDYKLTLGGEEVTVSGITESGTPYTKDIDSNTYTPDSPLKFTITPHLDDKLTALKGSVSDNLNVQIYFTETVTVTNDDGTTTDNVIEELAFEQIVTVTYSTGDSYVVTIPAEFPIEWDNLDEHDVSYSVITNMVTTSKLNVGVSNENSQTNAVTEGTDVMTNGGKELVYNYKNFTVTEFGYSVTDGKPDPIPTVWITQENWDNAAVGAYRDTLTYTVEYLTNQPVDDSTT